MNEVNYLPFSDYESVIPPEKALPNSIMVFVDISCKKQETVREPTFVCVDIKTSTASICVIPTLTFRSIWSETM